MHICKCVSMYVHTCSRICFCICSCVRSHKNTYTPTLRLMRRLWANLHVVHRFASRWFQHELDIGLALLHCALALDSHWSHIHNVARTHAASLARKKKPESRCRVSLRPTHENTYTPTRRLMRRLPGKIACGPQIYFTLVPT